MLRHAFYSCVFVLSFTAAQAEQAKNYFSVSAIIDATVEYDDSDFYDDETNSGFILTYGRQLSETAALEGSYVRYLDVNSSEGFLKQELTAIEISGVFSPSVSPAFFRLGYSHGEASTSSNAADISADADDGGLLYGIGMDFDTTNKGAKFRLEYTVGDYDDGEIKRITVGTFVNF